MERVYLVTIVDTHGMTVKIRVFANTRSLAKRYAPKAALRKHPGLGTPLEIVGKPVFVPRHAR